MVCGSCTDKYILTCLAFEKTDVGFDMTGFISNPVDNNIEFMVFKNLFCRGFITDIAFNKFCSLGEKLGFVVSVKR